MAVIAGLLIIGFVVFGAFISMIVSSIDAPEKSVDVRDKTVLIVDLSGGLPEYKPQMAFNFGGDGPSGPSLLELLTALRNAKTDDKIKGLYFRAGGVGVGMAKLAEVRDALIDFKTSGKFVYAFIDMGSKSHYFLASVADSIFMPQEGMVEFNAYGASAPFMKGMFDKIGVTWHVEQFEEYKSAAESMSREKWSEPAKEEIRAIITQRSDIFVKAVASGRKLNETQVRRLMNVGQYVPDSLLANGLIDGFSRESELKERIHFRLNPDDSTEHPSLRTLTVSQYLSSKPEKTENVSDKGIAIVYASGAISSGKNTNPFDASGIYSKTLIKDLRAARDDDDVDAIILRIDSPGGSAYGSDEIWAEIREIRKKKPVYASMSDVAASGGYYIAMACDTIIAHPATITGSIGVIMAIPNFAGTMGKIGVTVDTVSSGASSNFLNPLMPSTDLDKKQLHAFGEGIYRRFVQKVADSRKKEYEATRLLARGRVWTGEAAQSVGLIDVSGGLLDAIKLVKKRIGVSGDTKVHLSIYPEKVDNIAAILRMFGIGEEDDDNTEARAAVSKHVLNSITGSESATVQLMRSLPAGMRQQVKHAAQLAEIGLTEHSMVMMPMIMPLE
ncbi:MAG: signal peptide peptidase SppA [Candidatus Kapabacteria bacterium]|nr:signal peptide peptidase SppA [Candidatus Kapabacteria bacterium]